MAEAPRRLRQLLERAWSIVLPRVPRPLVLQPQGGKAKAYQVRQFLRLVEQYNLTMEDER